MQRERLIKLALFGIGAGAPATRLAKAVHFVDNLPTQITGKVLGAVATPLVGAPVAAGERLLLGGKNTRGALAGTRLRFRDGPGSVRQISEEQFKDITEGRAKGYAFRHKGVPMERRTSMGGLVGVAQRHPITSGMVAAGLLAPGSLVGQASNMLGPTGLVEMGVEGFKPNIQPTEAFNRLSNAPVTGDNPFARTSKLDWGVRHAAPIDTGTPA